MTKDKWDAADKAKAKRERKRGPEKAYRPTLADGGDLYKPGEEVLADPGERAAARFLLAIEQVAVTKFTVDPVLKDFVARVSRAQGRAAAVLEEFRTKLYPAHRRRWDHQFEPPGDEPMEPTSGDELPDWAPPEWIKERSARVPPPENQLRDEEALLDWASRHGLWSPWVLRLALRTLSEWSLRERFGRAVESGWGPDVEALASDNPLAILSASIPLPGSDPVASFFDVYDARLPAHLRRGLAAWDPRFHPKSAARQRLPKEAWPELDSIERSFKNAGFKSAAPVPGVYNTGEVVDHFGTLALAQVGRLRQEDIAGLLTCEVSSVQRGSKAAAAAFDLKRRRGIRR